MDGALSFGAVLFWGVNKKKVPDPNAPFGNSDPAPLCVPRSAKVAPLSFRRFLRREEGDTVLREARRRAGD